MILIAYDGSADAQAAVAHAGELLGAHPVTILTVWQPLALLLVRSTTGMAPMAGLVDMEETDMAAGEEAQRRAEEGAELARKCGLDAQARTCSQETTIAHAILEEAERLDAAAVVVGTRGLTGLKSVLLGSVSHAIIQHADRPVIVVPSADTAARRRHHEEALARHSL